ncbi:MAG: dTMP kinase [Gemmatimonadota bacterium]|nr:dTMP kinase [Gemmatimonadota bacterium]
MSGFFISFEGTDKSGKSTQAELLVDHLQKCGYRVVFTYEPGSTELGGEIRRLVLGRQPKGGIDATAEMFLFSADRAQHVNKLIRPSLDAGKVVISDRYVDSTLAYQGYGRGLDLNDLRMIQNVATGGLMPDITIWLDIDIQTVKKRELQRLPLFLDDIELEDRKQEVFQRVRQGFAAAWKSEPDRIFRVDGKRSVSAVFKEVKKVVIDPILLRHLYKINLKDWVLNTIEKVERGNNWNCAWKETYFELGGKTRESGSKFSPMNSAEVLYRLGRIKGSGQRFRNPELKEIWNYSTNGVYAILALKFISEKPDISRSALWPMIQDHIRSELGEEPAKFNQGAISVAYKLWHLGLIVHNK